MAPLRSSDLEPSPQRSTLKNHRAFLSSFENLRTPLGHGAYGKVELWRCLHSHEKRAIKSQHLQDGRDVDEWEREEHALLTAARSSNVDARHIVRLYASCLTTTILVAPQGTRVPPETPNLFRPPALDLGYLVMEHCDMRLMQFMQQHHRNEPLPQALQWSGQLFSGLTFMHSQGIIHRDLKPNNTLLVKTAHGCWDLKIADSGLSRKEAHPMTAAVVTLPYRAPEILFGALVHKAGLPKCLQQSSRTNQHSHLICCVCNVDRACCMCFSNKCWNATNQTDITPSYIARINTLRPRVPTT